MMASIKGGKKYSIIDLSNAYQQILLHPESKHLTSFVTPEGAFRFVRMLFEFAPASAVFQRVMQRLLGKRQHVMFFQNNVLV